MKTKTWIEILTPLIAIIGIITIEIIALCRGVDGVALSLAIGAISGLGGYGVRSIADQLRRHKKLTE